MPDDSGVLDGILPGLAALATALYAAWLNGRTRPRRVLVVEDEPLSREVTAAFLASLGCEVAEAATGVQGLELTARHRFDAVFVDLHLPDMSGIDVIREIREIEPSRRSYAAAMTGGGLEAEIKAAGAAGADAALIKPLQWRALPLELRRRLGGPSNAANASSPQPSFSRHVIAQMRALLPQERTDALIARATASLQELGRDIEREENAREIGERAHRLAGLAGQYGCLTLRRVALALERAADGGGEWTTERAAVTAALPAALAFLKRQNGKTNAP